MLDSLEWTSLVPEACVGLVARIVDQSRLDPLLDLGLRGRTATLPFYTGLHLIQLGLAQPGQEQQNELLVLANDSDLFVLDGTSPPVHAGNLKSLISLTNDTVAPYLRFFCFVVRGEERPFAILEPLVTVGSDPSWSGSSPMGPELARCAKPLRLVDDHPDGRFVLTRSSATAESFSQRPSRSFSRRGGDDR